MADNRRIITVSGSGSAGHIMPITAVLQRLKKISTNDTKIVYIGQKGDRFAALAKEDPEIDRNKLIHAGKYRRYHGGSWTKYFDIKTLALNLRDFVYVIMGYFEAKKVLKKYQPDAVFIKGGFIGVPVGLASAKLGIPIVTHDSDVIPGLANRIIARWVDTHAVSMDPKLYNYPQEDTVKVGVPVREEFKKASKLTQLEAKKLLSLDETKPLVLVLGGSLGATAINKIITSCKDDLTEVANIVHQTGGSVSHDKKTNEKNYITYDFIKDDMASYIAASDVIISRAGATALAEFATVGRPVILIPSPYLTGGHQVKNAEIYEADMAALVVAQDDALANPQLVVEAVKSVVQDQKLANDLSENLMRTNVKDSSGRLAKLILAAAERGYRIKLHR